MLYVLYVLQVVPALAAGCCVVLKPSELAPLSCLLLAEMCTEAGDTTALHYIDCTTSIALHSVHYIDCTTLY